MRRFLKIPAVFAVSVVILTSSPALATPLARHGAHCVSSKQNEAVCGHRTTGACVAGESCAPRGNATHDAWPANMILG
jgi:hypothetical protein